MHWKADAAARGHSHEIFKLLALCYIDVLPFLLVSEDSHGSVTETLLHLVLSSVGCCHGIKGQEPSLLAKWDTIDLMELHWDVHKIGALIHCLGHIIGYLEPVLVHRHDRLNLVGRGKANVTKGEDVFVNSHRRRIVVGGDGVLVGNTAFHVNHDLASFWLNTLSQRSLQEIFWSEILESSAVNNVLKAHFVIFTESLSSKYLNFQLFKLFNEDIMGVGKLWQELWASLTDSNSLVRIELLKVAGCLKSRWSSTNTEDGGSSRHLLSGLLDLCLSFGHGETFVLASPR